MNRALAVLGCLSGLASGNFVSPGLGKCLDLKAELKADGTRETIQEMQEKDPVSVQLYTCHGEQNQHYEIVNGLFKSFALENRCLTAEKVANNGEVNLRPCVEGNPNQQWDLTGDGYVRVKGSNQCLDVEAALKPDGTRENWAEIKERKEVNVHLYQCHDPEKTERVNQLWMWAPWQNGALVSEKTDQDAAREAGVTVPMGSMPQDLNAAFAVGGQAAGHTDKSSTSGVWGKLLAWGLVGVAGLAVVLVMPHLVRQARSSRTGAALEEETHVVLDGEE